MRFVFPRLLLLGLLASCAEAGVTPDGGGVAPDASAPSIDSGAPDADIKAPDATPPKPDAEPPPDAVVAPPDAPPGTSDAMVPPPDAPPPPDAMVPPPDAMPLPDAPAGSCTIGAVGMYTNSTATPIADSATTTVTVAVSGEGSYIARIGLRTSITHTWSADLELTLISPAGTRVLLTSDNGGSNDDVYDGTLWSDAVNVPVTDFAFADGVVATELTGESALSVFNGEDPNGTWTLEIVDNAGVDTGTISSWTVEVAALSVTPVFASHELTTSPGAAIPDLGTLTDDMVFAGIPTEICDIHLTTSITHTYNGDLDIILVSPMGTRVTLSTGNAGSNDDVFNGTVWDDTANAPVSEHTFTSGVTATPLTAESALGAFHSENPNGTWTLEISDTAGADIGTLASWTLDPITCTCP